jgi:hypothetical protein
MPGTLHEDLSTFYWYRRHKFAIKELLCKTQYCYSFDSDMYYLNNTQKLIIAFPLQACLRERAEM